MQCLHEINLYFHKYSSIFFLNVKDTCTFNLLIWGVLNYIIYAKKLIENIWKMPLLVNSQLRVHIPPNQSYPLS